MATEKKRSKGRFLYLFDWNAKSQKKLFSNKSESSEGSNQGKETIDNNLVIAQYLLRELRENGDNSTFSGSGNYSCASSINGDDVYESRAPGVVARLMGLDSMPTTNSCESRSVSSHRSRAVSSSHYPRATAPCQHERNILDYSYTHNKIGGSPWHSIDTITHKVHGHPIERFQTEVLPPRSAKPISITHHKLLSPIKSPGFVPTKDAAYIMEAAAKIIDPTPRPTGKVRVPSLGSPSSSFGIQDLKDKMDAAQRSSRLPESSKTPKESPSVKQVRGNPSDRARGRSLFKNIMGSETSSSQKVKNKGKSVSMAVQDKANMQRKEGSASSDNRSQQQKEHKQVKLKPKHSNARKAGQTRNSRSKISGVLRQNNDKQNSVSHKDKSTSKTSSSGQQHKKIAHGDNSAGPSKIVNKVFVNAENGSKKIVAANNVIENRAQVNGVSEKRPSLKRLNNISRNEQLCVRDNHFTDNVAYDYSERALHCGPSLQGDSRKDMDVISFIFTSPIKRSVSQSISSAEASGSNHHNVGTDSCDLNGQSDVRSSSTPPLGLSLVDSGSLSLLLEQKLKELTDKIAPSKSDLVMEGCDADAISCFSESISSHDVVGTSLMEIDEWCDKDRVSAADDDDCSSSFMTNSSQKWEDFEGANEHCVSGTNKCEASREPDIGHLNFFIPECSISESCMSSNTTSSFTYGYDQPSSPQSQELTSCVSTESVYPREDETEFSDTASYWELVYVRHMLHFAGLKRDAFGEGSNIIDPGLFDLLENLINTSARNAEECSKLDRKILFDCVIECVNSRYEQVFLGNHKAWAKWDMLLQNESFTEEIYKEILWLQSMENLMVDELVDRDMSTHNGRWLDFEAESLEEGMQIEEEIVASLVDELVADSFI